MPTKFHYYSSTGQEREKITKGSWAKTRTWRDHSAISITSKTHSGKQILLPIKSQCRVKRNLKKKKKRLSNTFLLPYFFPGLTSLPVSPLLPPRRIRNEGSGQFVYTLSLHYQFLMISFRKLIFSL